jgi:hypothetical protein
MERKMVLEMVIGESLDERLGETDEETSGEYRV